MASDAGTVEGVDLCERERPVSAPASERVSDLASGATYELKDAAAEELSLSGADWRLTGWYPNQWQPRLSMELGVSILPAVAELPATVPGSVQTDLRAAGRMADPFVGLDSLHGEWVTQREWIYSKTVQIPDGWERERCELVFEGLDYAGSVFWNGRKAADFEGTFLPVVVDVTGSLAPGGVNLLQVMFRQPPELDGQVGYSSRIRHLKARFGYGWDWIPRMVAVGIWRDVRLRTYEGVAVRDFYPEAAPAAAAGQGAVSFRTELEVMRSGAYDCLYALEDAEGRTIWQASRREVLRAGPVRLTLAAEVAGIDLWWPAGMGAQPLYRARIELRDGDGRILAAAARTIGFRRIEWRANPGSPAEALPYTAVVNGIPVFLRGVNWVPVSPYYGAVTEADYRARLDPLADMNVNVLRVWGGGIIETPAFYDYCDRRGLLVWQELLQSSSALDNCPPDDPQLLERLAAVTTAAVREKRAHPSLLLWCGGNELMWEGFRPVDERHANIAMLAGLIRELDPGRRFLPASASGPAFCADARDFGRGVHHDVHGPWLYAGSPGHYAFFNGDDALFRSETGTPGASRAGLLRALRGACDVWPPTADNPYWTHRGSWWVPWDAVSESFGPWRRDVDELEEFARCSRFLQKESLRYSSEATRRRAPQASGFLVWMGNEPFPNNANTSVLEYDGMPKPAYYALKKAFAPIHVSARYDRTDYRTGDAFRAEIHLHAEYAEALHPAAGAVVRAAAFDFGGALLAERDFAAFPLPSGSTSLGAVAFAVPELAEPVFLLRLEAAAMDGRTLAETTYLFTAADVGCSWEALRSLPEAGTVTVLPASAADREVLISNQSSVAAVELWIEAEDDEGRPVRFADNGLTLLPGECRTVGWSGGNGRLSSLRAEGFNARAEYRGEHS
ncbi:glycoside hydrolase family 2 protein [Cohnella hashimotonis]|uniref:Beta-mannosidase n=1 Tax=Cohnella hashimotonis TaxID=2826895 RepID=A0ABT6TB81_9BACL|nr:glycoside hydrolase family 2 TIM barrel-domain containing protein [Cohnella hashimotonis]MDI4644092.1 glycoside hydrolase family 2 TIM barrel-domain containing protein [Cohnella hashimotonis]